MRLVGFLILKNSKNTWNLHQNQPRCIILSKEVKSTTLKQEYKITTTHSNANDITGETDQERMLEGKERKKKILLNKKEFSMAKLTKQLKEEIQEMRKCQTQHSTHTTN